MLEMRVRSLSWYLDAELLDGIARRLGAHALESEHAATLDLHLGNLLARPLGMFGALRRRAGRLGGRAARGSLGTLVDDRGGLRREELAQQLGLVRVGVRVRARVTVRVKIRVSPTFLQSTAPCMQAW